MKLFGISKIVKLSLIRALPSSTLNEIQKIQEALLWSSSYITLCNKFGGEGLKNVDVKAKIISLQFSWVKKLFDDNDHD